MNGLELVVGDGHADEWVDVAGAVFPVQEPLPVGEQAADPVLAFGGRVDDLGRGVVGESRARHTPHLHRSVFDAAADELRRCRAEGPSRKRGEPVEERVAIPQRFFRGRVSCVAAPGEAKKPIRGGDNVLDFRTRLGLEQR